MAPAIHSLTGPNGLIYYVHEKSELFADIFEAQFSLNSGLDLPEVTASIQHIVSSTRYLGVAIDFL